MDIVSWATIIFSLALVGVTAYYAGVTRRIMVANEAAAKATQKQLLALVRPYISIRVTHGPSATYYLEIENTGRATAKNLKLKVDRDFEILTAPPMSLADTYLFKNGVSSFAPGNKVTFGLMGGHALRGKERDEQRRPPRFNITAFYEFGDEPVEEETRIDLDQYDGLVLFYGPLHSSIAQLAKEVQEIKSLLGKS